MNSKEMRSLVMAAQSQGYTVKVLRKGEVVIVSNYAIRANGKAFTVSVVISRSSSYAAARLRLREIGVVLLPP